MSHPTFSNQLHKRHVAFNLSDCVSRALQLSETTSTMFTLNHFGVRLYTSVVNTILLIACFEREWLSFLQRSRFKLTIDWIEYSTLIFVILLNMGSPSTVSTPWQHQSWTTVFSYYVIITFYSHKWKIFKKTSHKKSDNILMNISYFFVFAVCIMFWKEICTFK